jgi:hypothetical protein
MERINVHQGGGYLDDEVLAGEIVVEIGQRGCGVLGREKDPRSFRVKAATVSASVIRTTKSECPAAGVVRACTQRVPTS